MPVQADQEGRRHPMTRDNLLYGTIGVLAGFISGYFVHEVMQVRQPPPLAVLQAAQAQAMNGDPHAGLHRFAVDRPTISHDQNPCFLALSGGAP
jgi:hypothetical protein